MSSESKIDDERRRQVNGTQLIDDIGIDSQEISWRKDFTNFEQEDRQRLEGMAETIEPVIDETVDAFYDHLNAYEETVEIFGQSTKGIDQLKQAQRQYLQGVISGQYDEQYFQSRARIGKIHDMLDLGPKIYMGAYSVFYEHMIEALVDDMKTQLAQSDGGTAMVQTEEPTLDTAEPLSPGAALEKLGDQMLSLFKITSLDRQVAMDTYIHSYSQEVETELERQQEIAEDLQSAAMEAKDTGENIIESTEEISQLADTQADSMRNVAGEVSNMSATVEEIAATADEVATTSERAENLAEEGKDAADEALHVMDSVSDSSQTVVEDVETLQERIDEIDGIVEAINDIADQMPCFAAE